MIPAPKKAYAVQEGADAPAAPSAAGSALVTAADAAQMSTAIARRGVAPTTLVRASLKGARPQRDLRARRDSRLALPSAEEEAQAAARTQAALGAIVAGKAGACIPESVQRDSRREQFYRVRADPRAPGYNPQVQSRVIRMVEAQVDPMEPPKHRFTKLPPAPAEAPAPVLREPTAKASKEERAAWDIPRVVPNWKNVKGFTIALDKRLAADGRGLVDHSVNERFAVVAESLYIAEQKAREELKQKKDLRRQVARAEQDAKEKRLRDIANQARMDRRGDAAVAASGEANAASAAPLVSYGSGSESDGAESLDDDERVAAEQRERLREERRREREREMRMRSYRRGKDGQERERDVSEKMALGVGGKGAAGGKRDGEALFDSRLFNQEGGFGSGFRPDDEDNAYSEPMRKRTAQSIYAPPRSAAEQAGGDEDYQKLAEGAAKRFRPSRGFQGAEEPVEGLGPRTQPVQFEKAAEG